MSEERTNRGFFRWLAGGEEEGTSIYSAEELAHPDEDAEDVGGREQGFTVERAAGIIRELPPEVPRRIALRIVSQTLEAAGVDIKNLGSATRAREAKLNSRIELGQGRIRELKEKTDEVVRSLDEQIRKARQARDAGVADEESKISSARSGLEDVERVRDFFGFRSEDSETDDRPPQRLSQRPAQKSERPAGEDTQILDRSEVDDTQILRRPGPLSGGRETREE